MHSIDKVKKWEKKWVSVGGTSCKMKAFKWVPKEEKSPLKDEKMEVKTEAAENVKQESKPIEKGIFTAPHFLQNGNNEDSRDSFTASTAELMKYCPDPDSQDSITGSEFTATMSSDQQDDSTKPNSKSSTPPPSDESSQDGRITVSDAFKDADEPKAPIIAQPLPESQPDEAEMKENPEPEPTVQPETQPEIQPETQPEINQEAKPEEEHPTKNMKEDE